MARKKPGFWCYKCKKNLGSAAHSFAHFKKSPSHRNAKQKKDHLANKALRKRHGGKTPRRYSMPGLPTLQRTTRNRTGTFKFCTQCGTRKMPSHNYCGGCGEKL